MKVTNTFSKASGTGLVVKLLHYPQPMLLMPGESLNISEADILAGLDFKIGYRILLDEHTEEN